MQTSNACLPERTNGSNPTHKYGYLENRALHHSPSKRWIRKQSIHTLESVRAGLPPPEMQKIQKRRRRQASPEESAAKTHRTIRLTIGTLTGDPLCEMVVSPTTSVRSLYQTAEAAASKPLKLLSNKVYLRADSTCNTIGDVGL